MARKIGGKLDLYFTEFLLLFFSFIRILEVTFDKEDSSQFSTLASANIINLCISAFDSSSASDLAI